MRKADLAIAYGAESIMDLSNYGKTRDFRKALIARSPAIIGTVPIYDAIGYLSKDLKDCLLYTSWRMYRSEFRN